MSRTGQGGKRAGRQVRCCQRAGQMKRHCRFKYSNRKALGLASARHSTSCHDFYTPTPTSHNNKSLTAPVWKNAACTS